MHEIVPLIEQYGLFLVFVSVFVDQVGIPVPSYPVLLVAGALAATGQALMALIGVGVGAAVMADLAWYAVSARKGRGILSLMCRITLSPDSCVQRTESSFARFGAWTLPISKFVPGLGFVAVALSGITRMNIYRFVALDAVGALGYVGLPVLLGSLFKGAVNALVGRLGELGGFGVFLVLATFALYVAARWLERRVFARKLRMARISVTQLATMIESGSAPIIFDVRTLEERTQGGIIPGAVAAHRTDLDSVTASYPRDTEIVIYCSCPNEASAAVAALHLKRAGFANIRPLLGGIEAWREAGLPIGKSGDPSPKSRVADVEPATRASPVQSRH